MTVKMIALPGEAFGVVNCGNCKCTLRYDRHDVMTKAGSLNRMNYTFQYIVCANCEHEINVKEPR